MSGIPGLNFTSTRQSTSVAQNTSIAFNPVIATTFGGGDASGAPSGGASGYPSAPSNASGSDSVSPGLGSSIPSWLPNSSNLPAAPAYGNQSLVGQPNGSITPGRDRQSVVWGKSGSVSVEHGGGRNIKKK